MSTELGALLPALGVSPPGPIASAWVDRLARVECPAITARRSRRAAQGGRDPIVWAEARGANVVDVDGNRYVDLSAGFAVAAVGHRHPRVVAAVQAQAGRLMHAMGDLFPSREKIELGERLAARSPGALQHSILGANGSDAIEAAIKTALVATGRSRVLAFSGGYHGMSLGALGVSGYRDAFRQPFASFAGRQELRLPYANPDGCVFACETCDRRCLRSTAQLLASEVSGAEDIAAIVVEPIQARGGDIVPPAGWLAELQAVAHAAGALLIVDEIYTGFGRTGDWFACEREGVVPDLLVLGKALGGGLPISACIGTPAVMDAWGESAGEAIHTMTFLGNPMSAAAGLAVLDVLEEERLVERAAAEGMWLAERLGAVAASSSHVRAVRGRGMMWGLALQRADGSVWAGGGVDAMHGLLEHGFIVSPGGPSGDVISLSPPLVTTREQLAAGVDAIEAWLGGLA